MPPLGEELDLHCPECGAQLAEFNYQGTSNIIVNPCPRYHGVWLDSGEVRAIRIFMQHWAGYSDIAGRGIARGWHRRGRSQENAPQLAEHLANVGRRYQEMRESIVARGPSGSQAINELIYEALELLDRGRHD